MACRQNDESSGVVKVYRELLSFLNRRKFFLVLFLTLLTSVLQGTGLLMLIPLLSLAGISSEGQSPSISVYIMNTLGLQTVGKILLAYVGLVLIFGAVKYVQSFLSQQLRFETEQQLKTRLFNSLLRAHYSYLSHQKRSHFEKMVSQEIPRISFVVILILQVINAATLGVFYLAGGFVVSPKATGVLLFLIVVVAALSCKVRSQPWKLGENLQAGMDRFFEVFHQGVNGLKSIKASSLENHYDVKFREVSENVKTLEIDFMKRQGQAKFMYEALVAVLFSLGFYVSVVFFQIPVLSLLFCLVLGARLIPQAIDILQKLQQIFYLSPGFSSVMKAIHQAETNSEETEKRAAYSSLRIPFQNQIELEDVSFSYPSQTTTSFSLKNISMRIPFGSLTGISGASGAGKTTLVDILAGLISVDSGRIKIDGSELTPRTRLSWRSQISYLSQDPFLFSGTLRENLLWGSTTTFSDEELWNALSKAQASEFVLEWGTGLHSVIVNNGSNLSGGQRQRIALARSFLTAPSLLILDEVTSQLDVANQKALRDVLRNLRGHVTTLIISHNESFLEDVDQKIILENGVLLCENAISTKHSA